MKRILPLLLALFLLLPCVPTAHAQGWQIVPCPSCPGGFAAIPPWAGQQGLGGGYQGFQTLPYGGFNGGQFQGGQFSSPFGGGGYPAVGEQVSFGAPPASPFAAPPSGALPAFGGSPAFGSPTFGCNGGTQWAMPQMYFMPQVPQFAQPQFFALPQRRDRRQLDFDLNLRSRLR